MEDSFKVIESLPVAPTHGQLVLMVADLHAALALARDDLRAVADRLEAVADAAPSWSVAYLAAELRLLVAQAREGAES